MSEIDDGGPAFPRPMSQNDNGDMHYEQDGMSLRDYYAGQSLLGLLQNANIDFLEGKDPKGCTAKVALAFADAMIKARKGAE